MARLNANPVKSPLAGTEGGSLTDPGNNTDVGFTPLTITQFAQLNMTLATGSTQGLISGSQADKLAALPSLTQLKATVASLAETAVPIYVATPTDGSQDIYAHVLDPNWVFANAFGKCSAGSTNITVTINGAPITGYTNIPITTAGITALATAANTIGSGSSLGFSLTGTTGNCANLVFTMKVNEQITTP